MPVTMFLKFRDICQTCQVLNYKQQIRTFVVMVQYVPTGEKYKLAVGFYDSPCP